MTGGVFVVLLCGLAMAIVVAILEFCWNSKRNAQQEKVPIINSILKNIIGNNLMNSMMQQSLCSEMGEELRFALRCQGSRQRPTLRRNCVKCVPPNHTYVPSNNHDIPPLHGVIKLISFNFGICQ